MQLRSLIFALALACGCGHKGSPAEGSHGPAAPNAVGAHAPDAQLTGATGAKVALADLLHQHAQTVVVFYRGFY
ncbi:MAG TPA: hypothetical protein VFT22_11990 [Kofleriaceae bacterium]|nr:hypothetical protein [Kofleriaceae bacterium]